LLHHDHSKEEKEERSPMVGVKTAAEGTPQKKKKRRKRGGGQHDKAMQRASSNWRSTFLLSHDPSLSKLL